MADLDINVNSNLLGVVTRVAAQQKAALFAKAAKDREKELEKGVEREPYDPTKVRQGGSARVENRLLTRSRSNPLPIKEKPFVPYKEEQTASKRSGSGNVFILVSNINAAKDDGFRLTLQAGVDGDSIELDGDALFDKNEQTTYLYTWGIGDSIRNAIVNWVRSDEGYGYGDLVIESVYPQSGRISPQTGSDGLLFMTNIKQNFNGNYGIVIYGFASAGQTDFFSTSAYGEWSGNDGENIGVLLTWPPRKPS